MENGVKLFVSFITWVILQFMSAINLVDAYNGAIGAAQQSLHGGGCSFHRMPYVSVYSLVVIKVKNIFSKPFERIYNGA